MQELLEQAVTLKVNVVLTAALAISSALLGFGGKFALDAERLTQTQTQIKQVQDDLKSLDNTVRVIERSIIRTEEQGRVQVDILQKILRK